MIAAYLRERFRPFPYLPLAVAIAGAASLSTQIDLSRTAIDTGVALLLLLQFRLWDDLADRGADAPAHPNRVMVRAASVRRFVALCTALAAINLALALGSSGLAASTLVVLHAALGLWYVLRSGRSVAGDQLLLAKYPAFVLIVAGDRGLAAPLATAIAATAVYVAASIYEAWHDPASPVASLLGGRS